MRLFYATTLLLLTAGLSLPAAAQVMEMPGEASQSGRQEMNMPVRGMHKDQVRARFGAPREIKTAVGEPPITRWVYDGFTVYFEHSYVIQSVVNR